MSWIDNSFADQDPHFDEPSLDWLRASLALLRVPKSLDRRLKEHQR